jgi:transcriptional regulator with XRE-family HTH domain
MNRSVRNGDPQFLDSLIPKRIQALRKGLSVTAAQLDHLAGLGAGTTGRLERGDQRVYANHLFRIAQALGVDVAWFYGDGAADAPPTALQTERQRLLEAYLRIHDPALRRDVFDLVATLGKRGKT